LTGRNVTRRVERNCYLIGLPPSCHWKVRTIKTDYRLLLVIENKAKFKTIIYF
jgi:hypothetical protein